MPDFSTWLQSLDEVETLSSSDNVPVLTTSGFRRAAGGAFSSISPQTAIPNAQSGTEVATINSILTALRAAGVIAGTAEEPEIPAGSMMPHMVAPGSLTIDVDYRTPTWYVGPLSVGDPTLLTWNADGSVTIDAEERLSQPNGPENRTWYTGSIVTRVDWARGRVGAIVDASSATEVAAVFGYENDGGREIDFELTHVLDIAAWSPNVWMPRASGSGRISMGQNRILRRAPVHTGPQLLCWDLRDDRCDFYYQNLNANLTTAGSEVLFETIWASEMTALGAVWDVTSVNMETHIEIEWHDPWAGWLHDLKSTSMVLHRLTPTTVNMAPTGTPLAIPDITAIALNNTPRTVRGGSWTFTLTTSPSRAGFLADNLTVGLHNAGTGQPTAEVSFATTIGSQYDAVISSQGSISARINGTWNGYDSGTRRVRFTAAANPTVIRVTNNSLNTLHYATIKLEAV